MLGRLEMDVDECIAAYVRLAGLVFNEKSLPVDWRGRVKGKFDAKKLKDAIDEIVTASGASSDDPFNDGKERGCKTYDLRSIRVSQLTMTALYVQRRGLYRARYASAAMMLRTSEVFLQLLAKQLLRLQLLRVSSIQSVSGLARLLMEDCSQIIL